jgi:hypothetical protein
MLALMPAATVECVEAGVFEISFGRLRAAAALWGHVAAAGVVATAATVATAMAALLAATLLAAALTATATIATALGLAATARGGFASRGGAARGRTANFATALGLAALAAAMREQTATAALLAAPLMTTATIAAALGFAAAGVVVTIVATAGGFAAAAAAVSAAEHDAEQVGGIGLRRDTQQAHRQDGGNQTTFHGRLLKRLNTGGRKRKQRTHVSPEPPAPRCSWQNAAGRNRDLQRLIQRPYAESRRAIVHADSPA